MDLIYKRKFKSASVIVRCYETEPYIPEYEITVRFSDQLFGFHGPIERVFKQKVKTYDSIKPTLDEMFRVFKSVRVKHEFVPSRIEVAE